MKIYVPPYAHSHSLAHNRAHNGRSHTRLSSMSNGRTLGLLLMCYCGHGCHWFACGRLATSSMLLMMARVWCDNDDVIHIWICAAGFSPPVDVAKLVSSRKAQSHFPQNTTQCIRICRRLYASQLYRQVTLYIFFAVIFPKRARPLPHTIEHSTHYYPFCQHWDSHVHRYRMWPINYMGELTFWRWRCGTVHKYLGLLSMYT